MKENMKKWLCGLLTLVMTISTVTLSGPAKVEAASRTSGVLDIDTSVGWRLGGTSYGTEGLMTINGDVVYCLERLKNYYSGMTYTGSEDFSSLGFSSSMKEKLSLLAYFGKQRAKSSGNIDWYSVVGSAIWAETGQDRGWILSSTFNTDAKLKSAIQTLQGDVSQYYVLPSFQGSTSTVKAGETIRLTDTNKVLNTYTVKSADGLNVKIEGNDLVITGTASAKDVSTITFQKNIAASDMGVSIMYSAGADVQKIGSFKISNPLSGKVTINIEKYGNLQLIKKDNKGNAVPNTQFRISYHSDMSSPIGTYTTGSNGIVTISNLNPVNVYIQEISVPDHLVLNGEIKSIAVKANDTVTFTATNNWKQGYIQVVKKDVITGKTVMKAGTVFEVYNSSNTKVDTITTNEKGIATSKLLDYGTYYVKESKAADGYTLKVEVSANVGVVENGKTYQITVSNQSVTGQIIVEKRGEVLTDFKDGKFIYKERGMAGAKYNIFAKEDIMDPCNDGTVLYEKGSLVEIVITESDGQCISSQLPLGIYEIAEVKAPDGMVLNTEKKTVELKYEDEKTSIVFGSTSFVNERQKVSVIASKQDSDTKKYLAGCEIALLANKDIYNYDGKVIVKAGTILEKVITKDDGKAAFTVDLPNDFTPEGVNKKEDSLFLIKETKAPEGYLPTEITYYINTTYTTQDDTVLKFETPFFNKMTEVEISKQDASTGKELPGATLQVIDPTNGSVVEEWVSSDEPHILKGLTFEKEYILKETIAPDGYEASTEIKFTVGDNTKVIMKDKLILTDIRVDKVDSITKKTILSKDFVFGLYSDKECTKLITSIHADQKTGTATFKDLRYGTYYVKELEAPKGYKISEEVKKIIINNDLEGVGNVHSFVYENILLPAASVQTGDTTFFLPFMISLISALLGIGLITMAKKKRKNIQNKQK